MFTGNGFIILFVHICTVAMQVTYCSRNWNLSEKLKCNNFEYTLLSKSVVAVL